MCAYIKTTSWRSRNPPSPYSIEVKSPHMKFTSAHVAHVHLRFFLIASSSRFSFYTYTDVEIKGQWKELAFVWGCFHVWMYVLFLFFLQMLIRHIFRRAADVHVPHFIARHASWGLAPVCVLARSQCSFFLVMTCAYLEKHPSADLLHLIWLDAQNLCHLPPLYFVKLNISTSAVLTDRVLLIKPPKSSWDVKPCERISMFVSVWHS